MCWCVDVYSFTSTTAARTKRRIHPDSDCQTCVDVKMTTEIALTRKRLSTSMANVRLLPWKTRDRQKKRTEKTCVCRVEKDTDLLFDEGNLHKSNTKKSEVHPSKPSQLTSSEHLPLGRGRKSHSQMLSAKCHRASFWAEETSLPGTFTAQTARCFASALWKLSERWTRTFKRSRKRIEQTPTKISTESNRR